MHMHSFGYGMLETRACCQCSQWGGKSARPLVSNYWNLKFVSSGRNCLLETGAKGAEVHMNAIESAKSCAFGERSSILIYIQLTEIGGF